MALMTINSIEYNPTTFEQDTNEIQEAFRNTRGDAVVDVINTKRKLKISFAGITAAAKAQLLTDTAGAAVSVTYIDDTTNASRTSTFYRGTPSTSVIRTIAGTATHFKLSFSLIEL